MMLMNIIHWPATPDLTNHPGPRIMAGHHPEPGSIGSRFKLRDRRIPKGAQLAIHRAQLTASTPAPLEEPNARHPRDFEARRSSFSAFHPFCFVPSDFSFCRGAERYSDPTQRSHDCATAGRNGFWQAHLV